MNKYLRQGDNYVEMHCMWDGDGLAHNWNVGSDADGGTLRGATWDDLLSDTIDIFRWADDPFCDKIRARIWEIR